MKTFDELMAAAKEYNTGADARMRAEGMKTPGQWKLSAQLDLAMSAIEQGIREDDKWVAAVGFDLLRDLLERLQYFERARN